MLESASRATGIAYVDGRRLRRALLAGARRLMASQEHLNKINVYPVPDGDTGTNLALTMHAVTEVLRRTSSRAAGEVMTAVADAALDGARGNSGSILAQYFLGVSDVLMGAQRVDAKQFATAIKAGDTYARDALAQPVEGTVLSVMRAFAERLADAAEAADSADFATLWHDATASARDALAATPQQLEVLRSAGVVDAGGEGFVRLLEGIADYIKEGGDDDTALPPPVHADMDISAGTERDLDWRYCTECMVTGHAIERRQLKEALSALGGSLVLAGTHSKTRIHIHVNDPQQVFTIAARFGRVSATKADDMQRQQAISHRRHQSTVIVMDSAGDIPDEDVERLGIHMTPVRLHFGNESYLDKVTITADEFYAKLRAGGEPPKTSQPAPGDFRREFEFLASHYESVVCVSVIGSASGTYQAAVSAAERTGAADRIHVVDSHNVSVGQGLLALYAAECARAGMPGAKIAEVLAPLRARTKIFAVIRDLEAAVRGGRIRQPVKRIADALRLTPVLGVNKSGRLGALGVLVGRRHRIRKFARFILRRVDPAMTYRLAVGHTNCLEDARELYDNLRAQMDNIESSYFTRVGSALGAHTGGDGLVVALQEYRPVSDFEPA